MKKKSYCLEYNKTKECEILVFGYDLIPKIAIPMPKHVLRVA
jgi:hypothetical protein